VSSKNLLSHLVGPLTNAASYFRVDRATLRGSAGNFFVVGGLDVNGHISIIGHGIEGSISDEF
jgi:hypothetical protein